MPLMFFELVMALARALYPSLPHFLRTVSVIAGPDSLAIWSLGLGYMVIRLVLSGCPSSAREVLHS